MNSGTIRIVVLGASGLIGQEVALQLRTDGFSVTPVARRFTPAQRAAFGGEIIERPVVDLAAADLTQLLAEQQAAIVVNCIGVLQDSASRGPVEDAHQGFARRLVAAMTALGHPCLLVQLSVPGHEETDNTAFSATKRQAERCIAEGPVPYVILRPGFVVATAAYGGSALIRALAALPFDLPEREAACPFAATAVSDIARTIAFVAQRWQSGERNWAARWDVMERHPLTVGSVIEAFRRHIGGPRKRIRLPGWLMRIGAIAGDAAGYLGWAPPIRSTALAEMRRGVQGDPGPWIAATGIEPATLATTLSRLSFTVQEQWFARLYLVKALIYAGLALFWIVSGLIALTVAFAPATAILTDHGFPLPLAQATTLITSLADIAIGAAIALRRTSRAGLVAGIGLSLFYMTSAALITPAMWIDPLGALVKTGPAIILMLVALMIRDERG